MINLIYIYIYENDYIKRNEHTKRKRNDLASYYSYFTSRGSPFRGRGRHIVFPSVVSFSIRKVLSWRLTRKRRGLWGTEDSADGTRQREQFYLSLKTKPEMRVSDRDKMPAFVQGKVPKLSVKAKSQRVGPNTYATAIPGEGV